MCVSSKVAWLEGPAGRSGAFPSEAQTVDGWDALGGSSQLAVFEASTTAVGEGRPGEVGSRPGAGRGEEGAPRSLNSRDRRPGT